MRKKIGIFGSAFNPPTKGHADAISQVIENFDEVWLVPSYAHAHGKKPVDFEIRLELVKLLISELNYSNIKLSDVERECFKKLKKEYVYTYDLLKYLSTKYPNYDFVFICGEDNANPEVWNKFYKNKEIDSKFGKFIVKERCDIRSTYIRNAIQSNDKNELEKYTYPKIIDKILKLYKKSP